MKGPKRPNVKSDGYSDAKCKSDIELKGDSDTKFESDTNSDTDIQAKAKAMLERSNTTDDETTSFRLMNDEKKNGKLDVPYDETSDEGVETKGRKPLAGVKPSCYR